MLSNTGINKIILLGEVTTISEACNNRPAPQEYSKFTLVTNELVKKGNTTIEHQEAHNIKISNKLLTQEQLELRIGQTLYIEGKIQTTSYVDDDHIKRYHVEILVIKADVLNAVAKRAEQPEHQYDDAPADTSAGRNRF